MLSEGRAGFNLAEDASVLPPELNSDEEEGEVQGREPLPLASSNHSSCSKATQLSATGAGESRASAADDAGGTGGVRVQAEVPGKGFGKGPEGAAQQTTPIKAGRKWKEHAAKAQAETRWNTDMMAILNKVVECTTLEQQAEGAYDGLPKEQLDTFSTFTGIAENFKLLFWAVSNSHAGQQEQEGKRQRPSLVELQKDDVHAAWRSKIQGTILNLMSLSTLEHVKGMVLRIHAAPTKEDLASEVGVLNSAKKGACRPRQGLQGGSEASHQGGGEGGDPSGGGRRKTYCHDSTGEGTIARLVG